MPTAILRIIVVFLGCIPLGVFAQFSDNFSDGNFTSNPSWTGTTSLFTINGSNQLQTNGLAQTDTAYLSTHFAPDFNDTISWQLFWRMAFGPSDNNNSRIYLTADNDALGSDQINGYYLQIGTTGTDYLRFFRQNGSVASQLATGAADLSANPQITLKVIRYPNGTWQVYLDPTAGANFALELSFTDNQITTSNRFGIWCKYTQTNYNKFYFDDFDVMGTAYVDTEPPSIISAQPMQATQLHLIFSEPVGNTATNPSNYFIDQGVGAPASASFADSTHTSVDLIFGNSFPIADSLELVAFNLIDTIGNIRVSDTIGFIYYSFSIPGERDVVINELMADQSPPVGLPELEYLELFNATTSYILLTGMTITDGTSTGIISGNNDYLAPHEYAVVCSVSSMAQFSGFGKVFGVSSFPTLNNTGDDIRLYSSSHQLIDRVNYTDSWYGDASKKNGGYSLEQINPFNPCSGKQNWTASNASDGGTPGIENSVFSNQLDTVAPTILQVIIDSVNQISVVFDESMDSISLMTSAYSINNGITINAHQISPFDQAKITLILQSALDSGVVYRISIAGVQDCFGNTSNSITADFGIGVTPKPFELIINEIYTDPDTSTEIPDAEFIEVFNRSNKLLSTSGLSLLDKTSSSHLYNDVIYPKHFVIVCDDGNASLFEPYGNVIPVTSMPSLNNSDDRIALVSVDEVIDLVSYNDTWYGDDSKSGGGYTLERINPDNLCGIADNWKASNDPSGGTPGKLNSVVDTTLALSPLTLTGIQFSKSNEVTLEFNQRLDSISAFEADYDDNGKVLQILRLSEDQSDVSAQAATDFVRGTFHVFSVGPIENCIGQSTLVLAIESYLPDSADVIINEVLFNPRGSGSDYVEIYNRTSYRISLQGWSLGYLDSKEILQFKPLSETALFLDSSGYIALNEDSINIKANYFGARNLIETDLPSYANASGSVRLFDQLEYEMDRFDYNEDLQFALIDNPEGVSLERLSPLRSAKDLGNWHSASSEFNYGTPGFENSQAYSNMYSSNPFSLSSDFISPDNDGYQDVVNVQYKDLPIGMSATIKIFTDQGILVRSLCSNLLLGNDGDITWDGIDDKGEKAAIGIHSVWVQTFNLQGELFVYRLPLVVASKLN